MACITWLLLLPACGLVGRPSEKVVKVDTTPPGAMVNLNGLLVGTSPCSLVLPRSGGGLLEFEILPPPDFTQHLWVQRRTMCWKQLPSEAAVLYFDLNLEPTKPTQTIEVRER